MGALLLFCPGKWTELSGQQTANAGLEARRVRGIVVNEATNRPVAGALVTSSDQKMALLADAEGKFEFEVRTSVGSGSGSRVPGSAGLSAPMGGSIYLMARKPGYLPMERPAVLVTSDEETLKAGLRIKLTPEAIVTGQVLAAGFAEAAGVQVQLMQKQAQDGRGVWRTMRATQSNIHGAYRFADLAAGEYKIITAEWDHQGTAQVAGKQRISYPPLAFPGGASLKSGGLLHLAAGQALQADLNLRARPYYPVEIPLTNDLQDAGLSVAVTGPDETTFALGFNQETHQVEGALPGGVYHVVLSSYGSEVRTATVELAVGGKGVRTAPVSLVRGGTIPVVVREEYTAVADDADVHGGPAGSKGVVIGGGSQDGHQPSVEVYLQPDAPGAGGVGLTHPPTGITGNEGLVLENIQPGRYSVMVMPHHGYAATVTANGLDLLHRELVIGEGAPSSTIEITLRDDTGTLSGTLSPASARQASPYGPAIGVWCVPVGEDDAARFTPGFVDSEGKFTVADVPPGRYVVFAAAASFGQKLEYRDEAVLKRLESKGALVSVGSGQKVTLTVPTLALDPD